MGRDKRQMQGQRPAERAEPSYKLQQQQMMDRLPNDIGFLPETLVPPTGPSALPIYGGGMSFPLLQLYKIRSKLLIRDFFHRFSFWVTSPYVRGFFGPRTIKLKTAQIMPTAIAMHRQMYTAFAAGDKNILRKLCGDGLYNSFVARIESRPKAERWEWSVVRYEATKKVSNRIARLPSEGTGVHQAVVRIVSVQRLRKWDKAGKEIKGGEERKVSEYVVVQRSFWKWVESEWTVWGTVGESDWVEVRDEWKKAIRS
ncbi:hypothetical protein BJ878DRAFT_539344 [Calycina marina]|uniref:Tim44-like domain-containing protein n=1 Tax=Calycina marina TaxID=1763456 RepID=A0A9P7Z8P3_9HELO|nr:hypothetical protein BJ878DRAFT_539344 [Calycina marina]